ncbi:hypothetical protein MTO96_051290, partial [Rhipicephalus appendiculatus]
VPPTSLGKDDKLSRSFVVPWGNAPTLAAPQIAQCRQQSEYDKGTRAGAQGRINWPFVLVTVTVTVSLVAVGLATSSTGFKSFLISDYTSPPKLAPWALPEFGPWTAPVNAVQPWYQVVNGDDSLYTDPRHRLVCVFHADSVGLVAPYAGVAFGLARFPFALCSAVLFCCPSLGANLEPGANYPETLAQEFLRRALKNRFPRPLLMLGNSSAGNWLQWNDLLTQAEAGNLSSTIGAWYEERLFDGIVLHWPDSALTRATWSKLSGALVNLRAQLSTVRNMSLGVAIGQNVASGPHVASLASALGAASVYLLPPVLGATDYFGLTFSYYDESTLELLWRHVGMFLGQDVQSSVCYLLPADVFSFLVAQRHENASHLVLPSEDGRGVGPAGNATGVPGRMAYFEACRLVRDGFDVLDLEYGVVASRDSVWLSYTAPRQMKRFADALRDNLTAGCLGLWNPQWDDFAAACGGLSTRSLGLSLGTETTMNHDFFLKIKSIFDRRPPLMAGADFSPAVCKAVDDSASQLRELSMDLWNNPELAFKEVKSHDRLTRFLEERGLKVQRKYLLDTAFRAEAVAPGGSDGEPLHGGILR